MLDIFTLTALASINWYKLNVIWVLDTPRDWDWEVDMNLQWLAEGEMT